MESGYLIALVIGFVACITDLRSRRIPNVLTFGGAAAALIFHGLMPQGHGLASAGLGWVVGVAIFFIPFALGGLGAGDVKLLGALGAWLGPVDALWVALYTGVAGGVLAVGVALARGYLRKAFANIWLLLMHWRVAGVRSLHEVSLEGSAGPRLAYALPIFAGLVTTVWLR